jgi:hypothetical protein
LCILHKAVGVEEGEILQDVILVSQQVAGDDPAIRVLAKKRLLNILGHCLQFLVRTKNGTPHWTETQKKPAVIQRMRWDNNG